MSRKQLHQVGVRAVFSAIVLTAVFAIGSAAALVVLPRASSEENHEPIDAHDIEHEADGGQPDDHDHEEEGDHVALTKQAYQNLELRMGNITRGEYWRSLLVPGRVVEIPGQSNLSIAATVTGIVEDVNVLPGQTLETQSALFTIRITDEALIDSQSKLLELLTRQEVATQEIRRLQPLIDSGAVSGTKARDLQYELRQLEAQEAYLLQELASRGMPDVAINKLLQSRKLTKLASVYTPDFERSSKTDTASKGNAYGYSVETLTVHPGKSVRRGDALCTVAYHARLYVEGTAFQDDLAVLDRIMDQGWKVTVQTHENTHEPDQQHQHQSELSLDLLRIDNHVDEETQTVRFFFELPNQVRHTRGSDGRKFEQWRFRPGQRLHLRLPAERWSDQLTLPADAVVVDGPNTFVFVEHHHDDGEDHGDASESAGALAGEHHDDEEEHEVFMELEPVPVHVLYRDDQTVVIEDDGQLQMGDEIALNSANKLYLAMKMQAGGGGGHHHHHDH
ncbi:MAG TPA: hypothetical protein DDW52_07055 [Planctomycetaceae bacterium]|nr:hypothetical protein [Planctomycetaceae bacterium]